ncbi:cyclic nucleotide-binding domain-containing protein [Oleiagrimonas citrea]|uniref:Cyclic nucleotide-binding domain-containing protein n=1 Tax=Oleiagrimonas citrea TaxID=1665687 RepID=A0A846ZQ42_9GAMM|nr:patatin-like phospholipase family protein [Oleiagrimonas citrea]NKZ40042.1 cyclic nucleotide-binding domain-containing protein [Oleiagrimonas citrea]
MASGSLDTITLLRRTRVFGELEDDVLASVAEHMAPLTLPGGALLYAAGEPSDALYVLRSGSLGVFRPPRAGGSPHLAGVAGSGETLGTVGLLLDQPSAVTVRALRDTELLRLSRASFRALSERYPQAILGAAQSALHDLLSRGGDEPRILPRTFAILPHDASVPVRDMAESLRHALLPFGNCLLIDQALGRDHGPAWFAERESEMRFVLYVDEGRDERWRDLCRRQADALLLAVRSDRAPSAWPDRTELLRHADLERPRHLLLMHPGSSIEPGRARGWLEAIDGVSQHHHLRGAADIERLARLLARRSLGLVLSGGGARGFAAIGMVRALREQGYDVDRVGGTSIGAIVAAGVAMQWDHETMCANYRSAFVDGKPLRDWTLPLMSLSRGERTSRLLQRFFGRIDIEDLPLPFFCVSSDLTRGMATVHHGGKLWRWLRASSAVPGLLPPLLHDGHVYVDGAVINNLPTDVMYDRGMATIVACDIRADDVLTSAVDRDWQPGIWRQWMQRDLYPCMGSILLRSGMVNAETMANQRRELATRVIAPHLESIGLLDFKSFDRAVEAGYRATLQALSEPIG